MRRIGWRSTKERWGCVSLSPSEEEYFDGHPGNRDMGEDLLIQGNRYIKVGSVPVLEGMVRHVSGGRINTVVLRSEQGEPFECFLGSLLDIKAASKSSVNGWMKGRFTFQRSAFHVYLATACLVELEL